MSIDEAINILKQYVDYDNPDVPDFYTMEEAIKVIIKALEQDPSYNSIKTELEPCEDAVDRAEAMTEIMMFAGNVKSDEEDVYIKVSDAVQLLRELQSVTPQQKWIPVSEKLPPNDEKSYWICTENGYQCQCRWTNVNHIFTYLTSDWHWHIMDVPQYDKVVAWMPLPLPYKQEVEE